MKYLSQCAPAAKRLLFVAVEGKGIGISLKLHWLDFLTDESFLTTFFKQTFCSTFNCCLLLFFPLFLLLLFLSLFNLGYTYYGVTFYFSLYAVFVLLTFEKSCRFWPIFKMLIFRPNHRKIYHGFLVKGI